MRCMCRAVALFAPTLEGATAGVDQDSATAMESCYKGRTKPSGGMIHGVTSCCRASWASVGNNSAQRLHKTGTDWAWKGTADNDQLPSAAADPTRACPLCCARKLLRMSCKFRLSKELLLKGLDLGPQLVCECILICLLLGVQL